MDILFPSNEVAFNLGALLYVVAAFAGFATVMAVVFVVGGPIMTTTVNIPWKRGIFYILIPVLIGAGFLFGGHQVFDGIHAKENAFIQEVENSYDVSFTDVSKTRFFYKAGKLITDEPLSLLFSYKGQEKQADVFITKREDNYSLSVATDVNNLVPFGEALEDDEFDLKPLTASEEK